MKSFTKPKPKMATISAQFPKALADWAHAHAKNRPQGGNASQLLRELVHEYKIKVEGATVEKPLGIPTVKELRDVAANVGGGR